MKPILVVALVLLLIVGSEALPASVDSVLATQQTLHMRFEGLVNSVAADKWQVRDATVLVDEETFYDEAIGKAQAGAWVLVMATFHSDGSAYATKIQSLVPAS
jgi:hypothetical protein